MKKPAYSEKLKDPRWQKKRLEILERDEWKCQCCKDDSTTLHVHHKWYENGRDPWDYPTDALVTLCETCHETEHGEEGAMKALLTKTLLGKGILYQDFIDIVFTITEMQDKDVRGMLGVGE